jgi:DNA-binding CsgD family transcriptional regulator
LIGRERELARLGALLDDGGALMLRGPRGVGISALIDAAADRAAARGLRVLRATGVEWESGFAYAGLHQLLRGNLFDPPPAPAELEQTLRALDALVCVDELQWIDAETRAVLTACRRLLLGGHVPGPPGVEEVIVGPLAPDAAAQLLPPDLPLLVRERILREAAGLPLALVELAIAYADADDGDLLGSWAPLTPALEEAFAVARPNLLDALDDGDTPLNELERAAVRKAADPAARRAGHEALAARFAARDPDRATWHRVAAAPGLDASLAAEIEAVAWREFDHERAAAGLRRAALLTPPGPARGARLVAAALLAQEIGGAEIADRLLADVDPETLDALGRARWAMLRARGTDALLTAARAADPWLAPRLLWRAATELEASGGDGAALVRGAHDPALQGFKALVDGAPHRAAELLSRAAGQLRAQHRRTPLGQVLVLGAWARIATTPLDRVHAGAIEAAWLCERVNQPLWAATARTAAATAAALRGDADEAERLAAEAERVALPQRAASVLALVQQARGASALAAGRPAEAFAQLRRAFDPTDPACGRVRFATLIADLAEAASTDDERAFAREQALDAYAGFALDEDAGVPSESRPYLRARALLLHGMRLRRRRRPADSREPLRAAAAAFEALGARPWAERARRELAASVETARRGDQELERLTPRELEIARMAARGMTNPAIAADLALSPRTVGHHLGRIFPKLDVTSRAGLAAALARDGYAD